MQDSEQSFAADSTVNRLMNRFGIDRDVWGRLRRFPDLSFEPQLKFPEVRNKIIGLWEAALVSRDKLEQYLEEQLENK